MSAGRESYVSSSLLTSSSGPHNRIWKNELSFCFRTMLVMSDRLTSSPCCAPKLCIFPCNRLYSGSPTGAAAGLHLDAKPGFTETHITHACHDVNTAIGASLRLNGMVAVRLQNRFEKVFQPRSRELLPNALDYTVLDLLFQVDGWTIVVSDKKCLIRHHLSSRPPRTKDFDRLLNSRLGIRCPDLIDCRQTPPREYLMS